MEGKHLQDDMERFAGLLRFVLHAHCFTQIYPRRRREKVISQIYIEL